MRPLASGLLLFGALALWSASLFVGVPFPWEVTVRSVGRDPAAHPPTGRVLRAAVTAPAPTLEGFALGDAVQFDRYGILPPQAGSVLCIPFFGVQQPRIAVTPLGGRLTHAVPVAFTVGDSGALAGCQSVSTQPLVSVHP